MPFRRINGNIITRVCVADNAQAGIGGEDAGETLRGFGRAIGYDHLPGVLGIAHPNATAVMEGNPGRAADRIDQRIQNCPVRDRVGAVFHRFGFAVCHDLLRRGP